MPFCWFKKREGPTTHWSRCGCIRKNGLTSICIGMSHWSTLDVDIDWQKQFTVEEAASVGLHQNKLCSCVLPRSPLGDTRNVWTQEKNTVGDAVILGLHQIFLYVCLLTRSPLRHARFRARFHFFLLFKSNMLIASWFYFFPYRSNLLISSKCHIYHADVCIKYMALCVLNITMDSNQHVWP